MKSGPTITTTTIPALPRKADGRLDFSEFRKLPKETQNRLMAKMTTQEVADLKAAALAAKKEALEDVRQANKDIRQADKDIRQHQQNIAHSKANYARQEALLAQYQSAFVSDVTPKLQALTITPKPSSPKLR